MIKWLPIETAPKDGTPILVCGGSHDQEKYMRPGGRHGVVVGDPVVKLMVAPAVVVWTDDAWLIAAAECGYVGVYYEEPTHWVHVPCWPL